MEIHGAYQKQSAATLHTRLAVVIAVVAILKEEHSPVDRWGSRANVCGAADVTSIIRTRPHQNVSINVRRQTQCCVRRSPQRACNAIGSVSRTEGVNRVWGTSRIRAKKNGSVATRAPRTR